MQSHRIGIDLGGTKLLGIVINAGHTILKRKKQILTDINVPQDLVRSIVELFFDLTKDFQSQSFDSFGLALPSPVDPETGLAKSLVAFGWKNIPIGEMLSDQLGMTVRFGNDVNMATLAEYHLGAGRGAKSLFTFYPGTGLGGGYIHNGELVTGYNYTAAEVGHMVVQIDGPTCNCGQRGCLEAIVSNSGFKRLFTKILADGKISSIKNTGPLRSGDIVAAWQAGDEALREVLSFQARALGIGIANVINITGVERIVIGGNVYHALQDDLLPIVREYAVRHAIGNGMQDVEIRINELGNEAPALGATLLRRKFR